MWQCQGYMSFQIHGVLLFRIDRILCHKQQKSKIVILYVDRSLPSLINHKL